MDAKKYFEDFIKAIEGMDDNEFDQLLIDSGIENCPYEEIIETVNSLTVNVKIQNTNSNYGIFCSKKFDNNFKDNLSKVA